MWVLMSRKSSRSYKCVWDFLKSKNEDFNPRVVHCDYDAALIKSIIESFGLEKFGFTTNVVGCYFHWCQVLTFVTQNFKIISEFH